MGVVLFGTLTLALAAVFLVRDAWVYAERNRALDAVYRLAGDDIAAGREWEWRYEAFDRGPTYPGMVFAFWRPVSSFYRGADYLK